MIICILDYLPAIESIAVIVGVIFVAVQIRKQTKASRADHDRQKKQSTIEFYNYISTESQSFLDEIGGKKMDLATVNSDKLLRKSVVRYLSRLERLAIGIATNVYDFDVLNLMSGRYICKKFNQLKKYIDESRIAKNAPILFIELELLAKRIEEQRAANPNQTVGKSEQVRQP